MSGKLLQTARRDLQKVLTGGSGFEEDIIITDPLHSKTVSVKGIHSKHWIVFDSDGNPLNSKNAHITFMEKDLLDAGIITRNEKTGNVDIRRLLVDVPDATGIIKNYQINESYPSETFGCIVAVLGDFKKG